MSIVEKISLNVLQAQMGLGCKMKALLLFKTWKFYRFANLRVLHCQTHEKRCSPELEGWVGYRRHTWEQRPC